MSVRFDEGSLTPPAGNDRARLYWVEALPSGPATALLGLVHGYGDHAARYRHVMEHLAEAGIGVVAIDLRGHGRAEGRRGHVDDFREYVADVEALKLRLDAVAEREKLGAVPRFLFGHSMGGLVTFLAALDDPAPWTGLLHTGPLFKLALEVPWYKRAAAGIAAKLMPTFGLPSGLKGLDLTHDEDIATAYDNDPLGFKNATAGWFAAAGRAQEQALARASELRMPYWVCHGDADVVNSLDGSHAIFERVSSKAKAFHRAAGLRHEVLNESGWRGLVDEMVAFMRAQSPTS